MLPLESGSGRGDREWPVTNKPAKLGDREEGIGDPGLFSSWVDGAITKKALSSFG